MQTKKIVVTGGCGYIGSHTIVDLLQHGYDVISVDSLVNSSEDSLLGIRDITGIDVKNYKLDLSQQDSWKQIAEKEKDIVGIIHFAALKAVGESVEKPLLYYKNNLGCLLQVLEWMEYSKIPNLIFSSSCTVYGEVEKLPVTERHTLNPGNNPYGRTKQIGEWIIQDFVRSSGIQSISLRYFNPAGAHDSILIGEAPSNPALNLIPVITETAIGKRDTFMVFGTDYNTRDGSCIRDYIHIMDLARAHTLALKFLIDKKQNVSFDAFNIGIEKGLSVFEIIAAFEKTCGVKLNYQLGSRRPGDLAAIYSDCSKAKQILNWQADHTIDDIMKSAWAWEKKRSL